MARLIKNQIANHMSVKDKQETDTKKELDLQEKFW